MRRSPALNAVVASTLGTMIEWYDFYIYGFVAALVFGSRFFPKQNPYAGTLLAFATYFVGFAARPIGAAIFGHYGDRIGRKATLVSTLLLMGTGTFVVGLVPTYASSGIWGAVALTALRVVQGIGVGGEWGGSVTLSTEWQPFAGKRGLIASWPQFGSPLGLLLALGVTNVTSVLSGSAGYLNWGWRIPFLLSIVLVGLGLWIRLGIEESPIFRKLLAAHATVRYPVTEVIRRQWREIVLSCLARTGQQAPFYLFTTYVLTYGTVNLGFPRTMMLDAVMLTAFLSLFTVPLFGFYSDRFGRRRTYLLGAALMAAYAFPYFALLDSGSAALATLAIALSLPIHDVQYGPQAAFIAENFPADLRYSGASLGYQLSSLTAGGPAALIATWLGHTFGGSNALASYIVLTGAIGFTAACALRDRSQANFGRTRDP